MHQEIDASTNGIGYMAIRIQYWPSTFHEDKALESMLSGSHLSEEEIKELTQLYIRVEEIEGNP